MKNTIKGKSMTIRMDEQTETKFGLIWNILQSYEPPQIRLSRNEIFKIIVREYYQSLTRNHHLSREDARRESNDLRILSRNELDLD
jgi:hypothetical protein